MKAAVDSSWRQKYKMTLWMTGNSSLTLLSHSSSLQEPGQERLSGVGRRRAAEADVRQDEGQSHQETGNQETNLLGIRNLGNSPQEICNLGRLFSGEIFIWSSFPLGQNGTLYPVSTVHILARINKKLEKKWTCLESVCSFPMKLPQKSV